MTLLPMWATFDEVDVRAGDRWDQLPLLSVSQYRGVLPRYELDDGAPRADDMRIYKTCRPGDIILNRMSAYKGAVGVSRLAGLVSPDYLVMRPGNDFSPDFLVHLIKTPWFVGEMSRLVRGIGSTEGSNVRTPRIGRRELGSIKVNIPSKSEQLRAVAYLERETAEIDAFIADQEELIVLLTERRAATISHAVTKGLDPSAPIDSTGSSWFPFLPAHWSLIPIKLGAQLIQTGPFGSQVHSSEYVRDGIPLINPVHMSNGKITPSVNVTVTPEKAAELHRHSLIESDVVVARRGELGRCAVVSDKNAGSLCGTGSALIRLKPERFSAEYFQLVFSSTQARAALLQYSSGSTMDNLNADVVGAIGIPCPPLHEQLNIVRELNQRIGELDAAITDAREAIALSRERRAALISAAVTGKIDVRGAA